MCSRPFDTRSLPNSLAASLAVLPSMSLFPKAHFDLSVLPIYVARVPAAPFTHCFPRNFYVDRSLCPRPHASYLAALPSTRAISQTPVFYVAHPFAPFASYALSADLLLPYRLRFLIALLGHSRPR